MNEDREELRREILATLDTVPKLPVAVTRVLALVNDPDSGVADVMSAVETDPGLTAETLRIANSAYFAGPRRIGSLKEAGVLLGLNRVMQLVLAAAVFPIGARPVPGYDLEQGALVDGMLAVAVGTEILSRELKRIPPSHAFTAGLLHDIGKLAMGNVVARCKQEIRDCALVEGLSYEQAERYILGIDRAEAGAALLLSWQLPDNVVTAVRWHLQPEQVTEEPYVTDLVHVSRLLATQCGLGLGQEGLNYKLSDTAYQRLGLNDDLTDRTTQGMVQAFKEIRAQFG
jgi:HD-like signal output (HDOD) protein